MSGNEIDEFAELSAGHALHALSSSDEQRFQELLHAHPEWAKTADPDVAAAALLADATAPVAPPSSVRDRLLAQIAAPSAPAGPVEQREPAQPRTAGRLRRRMFALAASLVLLIGLGYGAVSLTQYLTRPASIVALDEVRAAPDVQSATIEVDPASHATAYWSASLQTAVLVVDDLPPLDPAQSYELWFVREGAPISAGVFEASAGETTALLNGDMHAGDVIAVTVEPAGGSPTGTPSGAPLFAIPTA